MKNKDVIAAEKKIANEWKVTLAKYGLTSETAFTLFGELLGDIADYLNGQVEIFDISPIDLKKCIKDEYVNDEIKSIGKCKYGDWEALSLFLSEEQVSSEKREYEKIIDELREECAKGDGDKTCNETPCSCELQPSLGLLYCDGEYIFSGMSRS